ncbi:hypothetical protein F5Y00DRAFT_254920 [Daldinia vernicosa]|uniref:uncharacterized protein n=1 Tax=Daldinia vernicosa TaxID=114800 RepID=UPI00200727DF|nr:uncharacterized protein F5Y00DRAFT_254920 [Daldinia vernicosa]KAI0845963.1 hypothetical protein F5Y00DRAFT_254920 [Daldinia vernicosa]
MEPKFNTSLRPSNSTPSLKAARTRPISVRSTGSRSYRHTLLKSEDSTDQLIRDLPIPPVLTQGPPELTERDAVVTHRLSRVSIPIPIRKSSKADLESQIPGTPVPDETRRPGIVCIDPTIHPPDKHAEIHHPGLIIGADFCDAGLAVERDSPIRTPPSKPASVRSAPVLTGRVRRVLSGGDICEDIVDVSEHIHKNHSSATKVRPAIGLIHHNEKHGGHFRISKVQPAREKVEQKKIIHQSRAHARADVTPEEPYVENIHHGHSLAPKVHLSPDNSRDSTHHSDPHDGHIWVQKVQPYHESASTAFITEENSIPRLSVKKHVQQGDDSAKSTSYWGFLPGFRNQEGEKAGVTGEPVDDSIPHVSNENHPSLSASQYSASQKSLDTASKTVARLTEFIGNQEIIRHANANLSSLGKLFSHSEDRVPLRDNGQETEIHTASVSPTSYARRPGGDENAAEQSILPEGIDPAHAATWLRQFFGHPEPNPPSLTQLPEKSHPRHEDHDDYPNNDDEALASRATSFSGKTSKEAGIMDTAMHNLEQLLDEALFLANEATENDHCGHGDDKDLISRLQNATEPFNIPHILSDAKKLPDTIIDTAEEKAGDLKTSSSKPATQEGPIEPDMRNGNIARSDIKNGSNIRGLRKPNESYKESCEVRHQVSDGEHILPLPPPGSKLKRQYVSPTLQAYEEDDPTGVIRPRTKAVPNSREVREYIRVFHQPPITPRHSSKNLSENSPGMELQPRRWATISEGFRKDADVYSLNDGTSEDTIDFSTQYNNDKQGGEIPSIEVSTYNGNRNVKAASKRIHELRNVSLRSRSHVSIRDGQRFSLTKSVKRQPIIARDWSPIRKRFVASVACISTALIGILVGIYAGLVPSIQYFIADFHHYSIIGNVVLYLGMALSTFFCWPLPLLHGRKPYILCSLSVALPLLFPQAVAVSIPRSPYTSVWRWALLLPRAIMGCALGFASMNFHSILTDLFGASLMSSNPHQEVVDQYDVRRHGGGLGIWLGVWTWCFIGSLGIGFLIGAVVIDTLKPSWGLYISIMLIALVLLLNVLRSVAEVRTPVGISRRVARGEIMMHRVKDGPKWWGQEMYHGVALSLEMLRQPGFSIMAIYSAWIYAQVVLIIVLLGSLSSRHYHFRSPYVGAAVSSIAIGALAAVPFQMANLFSRSRWTGPPTNSMTFEKSVTWTSHLVRRSIFIIVLPIAGILYTVVSSGPPVHVTWDCSDFQPGMTGRSRSSKDSTKRTNYSSFPRVTAGWNIIHSIGFILAAGATGIGGIVTRNLGQRAATGIVASILFIHSLLLLAVFARFRRIQIIPNSKSLEMERWTEERRHSLARHASAVAAAKANGLKDVTEIPEEDKFRRMNILELGSLTRWSEIRKKNRLIDEGVHLNRQTVNLARDEIDRKRHEIIGDVHRGAEVVGDLVRKVSKRSKRSHDSNHDNTSRDDSDDMGPLGPAGAGLEHEHSSLPREVYAERECVMGQAVPEEAEVSPIDDASDDNSGDEHEWIQMEDHSSHMTSKVQPYTDFKRQKLQGGQPNTGDYVIDMDTIQGEHTSHSESKVKPAELGGSEQHGIFNPEPIIT